MQIHCTEINVTITKMDAYLSCLSKQLLKVKNHKALAQWLIVDCCCCCNFYYWAHHSIFEFSFENEIMESVNWAEMKCGVWNGQVNARIEINRKTKFIIDIRAFWNVRAYFLSSHKHKPLIVGSSYVPNSNNDWKPFKLNQSRWLWAIQNFNAKIGFFFSLISVFDDNGVNILNSLYADKASWIWFNYLTEFENRINVLTYEYDDG